MGNLRKNYESFSIIWSAQLADMIFFIIIIIYLFFHLYNSNRLDIGTVSKLHLRYCWYYWMG